MITLITILILLYLRSLYLLYKCNWNHFTLMDNYSYFWTGVIIIGHAVTILVFSSLLVLGMMFYLP
jgi:hypothetical protein